MLNQMKLSGMSRLHIEFLHKRDRRIAESPYPQNHSRGPFVQAAGSRRAATSARFDRNWFGNCTSCGALF